MSVAAQIKQCTAEAIESLFKISFFADDILVNQTKPEFEGDYTVVLFSLIKQLKQSPESLGQQLGERLIATHPELFTGFNVIKGFLNLTVADRVYTDFLQRNAAQDRYGLSATNGQKVMVEYSSPNTNKPLHLGHLRNNFLGWSVAEILKARGYEVLKSSIVNDRGIHICKSMIAWEKFGNGETPQSTGLKGDHFVGDYYVKCENQIKTETAVLNEKIAAGDYSDFDAAQGEKAERLRAGIAAAAGDFEKEREKRAKLQDELKELVRSRTPIMRAAQQMLVDWEAGKPEVRQLWEKMNGWVYEGFGETYTRIGSDFDKTYYESQTYLLGRQFVEEGLESGVFFRKEDGSVWIDLTAEGLDEKLVQRRDGTSVYITQDLGLADQKYREFPYDQSIYVIGDEQNYHMKVLKLILQKLGKPYADGIFHLSYGMVELPSGRMKSREGTVVDADDLVDEMMAIAARHTEESGKVKDFSPEELKELYAMIGLGALKFYLLRVDPKKKMVFNPEESIDFHGFTGPFVQYTHARIQSILRKAGSVSDTTPEKAPLLKREKELLSVLEQYEETIKAAATDHNPSLLAIYAFTVAKTFNAFYTEHSVMNAESEDKKALRLQLCRLTATVIRNSMQLLGIQVPERM